jgi:hypothetical protein
MSDAPRHRCQRCDHGPSTHTGGHGQCWSAVCGCDRYVDAIDAAVARHPAGKAIPEHLRTDDIRDYLRQKGEIQ